MLIRSQDRKCIVALNSIAALAIRNNKSSDKFDIVVFTPPGSASYGGYAATTIDTYSTEAKAIKVLDMIEDWVIKTKREEICYYVFYMPADEEVEI